MRPTVPIDDLALERSCINGLSCAVYNNPTLLAADENCDECELELNLKECATPVACNDVTLLLCIDCHTDKLKRLTTEADKQDLLQRDDSQAFQSQSDSESDNNFDVQSQEGQVDTHLNAESDTNEATSAVTLVVFSDWDSDLNSASNLDSDSDSDSDSASDSMTSKDKEPVSTIQGPTTRSKSVLVQQQQ